MRNSAHILVVDDEHGIRELLRYEFTSKGYQVATATNGAEALDTLKTQHFDLIISDLKMPKLGGLDFLDAVKKAAPDIEVIMATGFGTVETAVDAMKKGAYDFIQKPFNIADMHLLVEKALDRSQIKTLMGIYESSKLIFSSGKLNEVLKKIGELCLKNTKSDNGIVLSSVLKEDYSAPVFIGEGDASSEKNRQEKCQKMISSQHTWRQPVFEGSSVFYPLIAESQFLGLLNLNRNRQTDVFSQADIESLPVYAVQMAQVIYNTNMQDFLEQKMSELNTTYQMLEKTQDQLIESDKLAKVGQMTAGVVHDLNNPLNGIFLTAQLLLDNESTSESQKEDLKLILAQSEHCNAIIQDLLRFSRKNESHFASVDLVSLLRSSLQLIRHDFKNNDVEIETAFDSVVPMVMADPTKIQQVFLNLLTNARHAVENKEDARLEIKVHLNDKYVVASIADNGCGIAPENIEKIFSPFFTTKSVGKGTGLGLSICREILQQHQADIAVESTVGVGTTFRIFFPIPGS